MPCLEIQKECFLFRRKGTRLTEEIGLVIEDVGESHCFQSVADPVRGGFLPEDLLEGVRLEHGIRITVAVAQKGVILHVEEKYP